MRRRIPGSRGSLQVRPSKGRFHPREQPRLAAQGLFPSFGLLAPRVRGVALATPVWRPLCVSPRTPGPRRGHCESRRQQLGKSSRSHDVCDKDKATMRAGL